MQRWHRAIWGVCGAALWLLAVGGCPPDNNGDSNQPDSNDVVIDPNEFDTSIFSVVKTDIDVYRDASLECGDDLIVFGTGTLTGVAYVVPSEAPTAATPIVGAYRSDGFAVAGKKVLLFDSDRLLTVFDTETQTATPIARGDISLRELPTTDEESRISPVIADGMLAITRSFTTEVDDGRMLKVVDVSVDPPLITALQNPPVNVTQMAIDAEEELVVTFGGDKFYVYDITQPDEQPQTIDLTLQDGIAGPFAYDDGYILYVANATPDNLRLVTVSEGQSLALATVPSQRLLTIGLLGGTYAYFLDRDAFDRYDDVYRIAVGSVPDTTAVTGGAAGDPDNQTPPWKGFGNDLAVTPGGEYVFFSGDGAITDTEEFLQVSDGEAFGRFVDGTGFLNASDVDVTADLVAFKTGADENTKLGYIVLP